MHGLNEPRASTSTKFTTKVDQYIGSMRKVELHAMRNWHATPDMSTFRAPPRDQVGTLYVGGVIQS
jgi:hypothetical protein